MLRNTHPQVDELIATLKGEIGSEIQRNGAVSHNAINHREKALHSDTLRATKSHRRAAAINLQRGTQAGRDWPVYVRYRLSKVGSCCPGDSQ